MSLLLVGRFLWLVKGVSSFTAVEALAAVGAEVIFGEKLSLA
jgi:hypothetical protein